MGRSNRYRTMTASKLSAHESRRELQRTRAEAIRQRDMYMMIVATFVLGQGGEIRLTPEDMGAILPNDQVQVQQVEENVLAVRVLRAPKAEPESDIAETSELNVRVVEDAGEAAPAA